jgi:hypothetical protein
MHRSKSLTPPPHQAMTGNGHTAPSPRAFHSRCCETITAFVTIRSNLSWVAAISGW